MEQVQALEEVLPSKTWGGGGFVVKIMPFQSPFALLFTWYRWMGSWNISLSTEAKVRSLAHELVGPNLASELVPFTFSMDGGGEEVRKAPMAYIPDLQGKIVQLLDQNDR